MAKILQIKIFNGNSHIDLEKNLNKFMADNDLLLQDFIDIQLSVSGLAKKDKDGEALFFAVLVYRKDNGNG